MIKAEATVVGTVTQSTQIKQNQKGGYNYIATVKSAIPMKEGGFKEVSLHVSAPQEASAGLEKLGTSQHVMLQGTLYFRKDDEQVYLNLSVKAISEIDANLPDNIAGELTMIGKVGSKGVEVRNSKNGKPVMNFSAYSGDGEDDKRVFTWVRFVRFSGDVEPFIEPKALIQASGDMELQFYKDKLSIGCKLKNVQPYVKKAPDGAPF